MKKNAAIIDEYKRAIRAIDKTKKASKELLKKALIFSLKFNGSQIKYLSTDSSISEIGF